MPDEGNECDVGWMPGPIDRAVPKFTGPEPGPTDPALNSESSPVDVMKALLKPELLSLMARVAKAHCIAYRSCTARAVIATFTCNASAIRMTAA